MLALFCLFDCFDPKIKKKQCDRPTCKGHASCRILTIQKQNAVRTKILMANLCEAGASLFIAVSGCAWVLHRPPDGPSQRAQQEEHSIWYDPRTVGASPIQGRRCIVPFDPSFTRYHLTLVSRGRAGWNIQGEKILAEQDGNGYGEHFAAQEASRTSLVSMDDCDELYLGRGDLPAQIAFFDLILRSQERKSLKTIFFCSCHRKPHEHANANPESARTTKQMTDEWKEMKSYVDELRSIAVG